MQNYTKSGADDELKKYMSDGVDSELLIKEFNDKHVHLFEVMAKKQTILRRKYSASNISQARC